MTVLWLRASFFALLGPGTVLVWGPVGILASTSDRFHLGAARWLGLPLLVVGVSALLWCIHDFVHQGRGTLAPVDAPRFVVRGGLYRFVRNPMYLSVVTALIGEILLFRSPWLLAWAGLFAMAFVAFVPLYEERRLARQFGHPYQEYKAAVPRWLPKHPKGQPDR